MPAYDSSLFNPPAPLAKVGLRDLSSGKIVSDVPMLIDSGADITLVPEASVEQLGLHVDPRQRYELKGFDGHRSLAKSVELDLVFLKRTFRGRFLVVNSESGILGRDVLNHLTVLLDGPRLNWQEQQSSPL
jgi:hypothetical protein